MAPPYSKERSSVYFQKSNAAGTGPLSGTNYEGPAVDFNARFCSQLSHEAHRGDFDQKTCKGASRHLVNLPASHALEKESLSDLTAESSKSGDTGRSKFKDRSYRLWIFELLSLTGSLGSIVAILAVLRRYDGQNQPGWPHGITLNSVISWFTSFFKTSLLVPITASISQARWIHFRATTNSLADVAIFDAASRGPLGALKLLWGFPIKYKSTQPSHTHSNHFQDTQPASEPS